MCNDFSFYSEGLESIQPYIPGKPIEEVRREFGIPGEIIKLASNENPLGPSPLAIKKMLNEVNLYHDGNWYQLWSILAKKYNLDLENFVFSSE